MRSFGCSFFLVLALCQVGRADLFFSLEQATLGTIAPGSTAVFNIFLRAGAGTVDNSAGLTAGASGLAGFDFVVDANDAGLTNAPAISSVSGSFSTGTSPFIAPGANGGFQLAFPSTYQVYTVNTGGSGLALGTSNQLVATVSLATTASMSGTFDMHLSGIAAVDAGFNSFTVVNSTPVVRYTISAVPEPSSFVLMGLAGCGLVAAKRFRRKPKVLEVI